MTIAFVPKDENRIVADYQAGKTAAQIARDLGVSFSPIERILRARGVYDPRRSRAGHDYTSKQRQRMVDLYREGASIYTIGRKTKCPPQTVWKILRAAGVEFRDNAWKGGRVKAGAEGAYVAVAVRRGEPFADMANVTGYVLEHRLVMARSLGRSLTRSETVHHINGDKTDNRLENLQLRQGRHGKGARFTCLDCGSHNVEAVRL
jgi:transposase-like protein